MQGEGGTLQSLSERAHHTQAMDEAGRVLGHPLLRCATGAHPSCSICASRASVRAVRPLAAASAPCLAFPRSPNANRIRGASSSRSGARPRPPPSILTASGSPDNPRGCRAPAAASAPPLACPPPPASARARPPHRRSRKGPPFLALQPPTGAGGELDGGRRRGGGAGGTARCAGQPRPGARACSGAAQHGAAAAAGRGGGRRVWPGLRHS